MAKPVDLRETIMVSNPGAESSDAPQIERFEVLPLDAIRPYEEQSAARRQSQVRGD